MSGLIQIHEPGKTPLPHADVMAIGIDLGTTHSVVAVSTNRHPEAIHDAHGRAIIPSVVQVENHHIIVGHEARRAALEGESGVIASVKRLMGRSSADVAVEQLSYTLDGASEGSLRLRVGTRSITPVEISAEILRHLKHMAVDALGREVTQAVITVPAYFDDAARAATKDAAKLAGLDVLRLINEPTAAALAYGLDSQAEGVFAIYDMGGGTFDISILKLQDNVFQVLATAGDTQLGGDDMDRALAHYVMEKSKSKKAPSPSEYGQLLGLCRQAKERLSEEKDATITWGNADIKIARAQLESLVEPLVARSILCCERALSDTKLTAQSITGVVLVGGATRMRLVKAKVAEFFGKPALDSIDPDLTVALGAAIQAEALTLGSDHLLLDVIPLSLGLETMGGIVEKVMFRNTPIPASVAQEFTTYKDGQTAMKIHVVQGEREKVSDCRSLANFELRGIPSLPAGIARIRVTFTIDADGLLTVAAKELTTGIEQQIEVKPSYGLEFEEIERMLALSMQHARSDIMERLLIEARVEAGRAIAEVESAVRADSALLKQGEPEMLNAQMQRLQTAAQGTDRERIDYERTQLNQLAGAFAERRMDKAIAGALTGKRLEEVK